MSEVQSKRAAVPGAAGLRPAVAVATVYADDGERFPAYALGAWLYELLVRPHERPLTFGGGVRVFPATQASSVDTDLADLMLLVPVLGAQGSSQANAVGEWREVLGDDRVVAVTARENWRPPNRREPLTGELSAALTAVLCALAQRMSAEAGAPTLYVSYAERDCDAGAIDLPAVVDAIRALDLFHDVLTVHGGDDGGQGMQMPEATRDSVGPTGMLLALHSDGYGQDGYCPTHLLAAKRRQWPIVVASSLGQVDRRSPAYLGNTPTVVRPSDSAALALQVLVEWVRAEAFRLDAVKCVKAAELPFPQILTRAPELVDVQGDTNARRSRVVVYPDPPLSAAEEDTLRIAAPRMRLVTPTNAYRALPTRRTAVDSPLQQLQVAISVSDSLPPAKPGESEATAHGVTRYHLDDALIHVARSLISAGAAIAYGGDFRREGDDAYQGIFPRGGYVQLLAELVRTYDRTGGRPEDRLHSYLAAVSPAKRHELPGQVHDLAANGAGVLGAPSRESPQEFPLYYSDMRRVMARAVDACVVMGGQSSPRERPRGPGYQGLYSGVLEEVWQMLYVDPDAGPKPLYVCGGFEGAGAIAARLLRGQPVEPLVLDDHVRARLDTLGDSDKRKQLGIPKDLEELAKGITVGGARVLKNDETAVAWNGLTLAENQLLMGTRDPLVVAQLVLRGLLALRHQRTAGQLSVELVRGSVTHAPALDVLCLPYCEGLHPGGAAEVFTKAAGGRASLVKDPASGMIPLSGDQIAPHWLRQVPLSRFDDVAELAKEVREGTREVVKLARRYAFSQIGLVTFGASANLREAVDVMLDELGALPEHTQVMWFEIDVGRFQELKELLGAHPRTILSTRWLRADVPAAPATMPNVVTVRLNGGKLRSTVIPAQGTSVAPTIRPTTLSNSDFKELSGPRAKRAPSSGDLGGRGRNLDRKLFDGKFEQLRGSNEQAPWVFVHDAAASSLHYESLGAGERPLALDVGVRRKLASPVYADGTFVRRARSAGPLRVLLVVDPDGTLPHARDEANSLRRLLENFSTEQLELTVAGGAAYREASGIETAATVEVVTEAMQRADVLHYCGHAYFTGDGPNGSGLVLEDERLTAGRMGALSVVPRVAVVNACEAGRIRGRLRGGESTSFAEMFLRAGVVAYVGTLWRVADAAARVFAERLYHSLAVGLPLDEAVRLGRKALHDQESVDWANYVLYGDAEFVLDF